MKKFFVTLLTALLVLMGIPHQVTAGTPQLGARWFVQGGSSTAGTTATCTFPGAPTVGDVVYVVLELDHPAAVAVTTPTGTWTQIDAVTDGTNQYTISYWHTVTASDTQTFSFTWATAYIWGMDCYDLAGVGGVGAHNMQTFVSTTSPTTAAISDASNSNDLPIATFSHTSNINCPSSWQTGWLLSTCGNGGVGLPPTAAYGANTTAVSQSESFSATWTSGFAGISSIVLFTPSSGPANLMSHVTLTGAGGPHQSQVIGAVAGIPQSIMQQPTAPTMLLACSGSTGCEPGSGTSTLISALDIPKATGAPAQCPGWNTSNCQAFAETDIANCQTSAPSVSNYAYTNNHPADFTQKTSGTPVLTNIYFWGNTSGTNCAAEGGSNTTLALLDFSQTQTVADAKNAVTSTYIPTGAIIIDDNLLDYGAPLTSYTICNGCGHTFTTGGGSTRSLEQNIASTVAAMQQSGLGYKVMVNGLSMPGGTTVGCSTVTSNVCYGDSYNPGMKNSQVYDSDLGAASMAREEWAITRTNTAGAAPQANWGANLAYLLNTAYEAGGPPVNYQSNTDCTNLPGSTGWPTGEESVLWAMTIMGPYSNGRPVDYQQPYGCGVEHSITTDNGYWPVMGIVPFNPINSGGAYTFCTATCTTAHNATWAGSGCTANGGPVSTGTNDSGGIHDLVYGCVTTNTPVLYRQFQDCSVYLYDVGSCVVYINTSQSTAATVSTTGYTYELSFSGSEFGHASGGSASYAAFASSFLSWLPTSDPGGTGLNHYQYLLYAAMSAAWTANGSAYDNGWFSFGAASTSCAANAVCIMTANKPPGY